MIFLSVKINEIDMLKKYKMALADRHCVQPPVPKMLFQDVPGADGSLDLSTTVSERPVFQRRIITLNFGCGYSIDQWPSIFSEILASFHGKEGKIIFDDDPSYFYIGRMEVESYQRIQRLGTFTIKVNSDPYKYELLSSIDDWLWDPFNFETGIIREYANIEVNGSYELLITGTQKWIIPEITVSADMIVQFGGSSYHLTTGTNKIYSIVIREGNHILTFIGNGIITVKYRGGVL